MNIGDFVIPLERKNGQRNLPPSYVDEMLKFVGQRGKIIRLSRDSRLSRDRERILVDFGEKSFEKSFWYLEDWIKSEQILEDELFEI